MRSTNLAFALLLVAGNACAASQVVPSSPAPFETVNLRTVVDSCSFVPSTVRVNMAGDTLRVTQVLNACFAPGTPYSYGPPTICGISSKLKTGGGDETCHSSVIARHGLAPAIGPRIQLTIAL